MNALRDAGISRTRLALWRALSLAYGARRLWDKEYRDDLRSGRQHRCDRFVLCMRIESILIRSMFRR